MNYKAFLIAFVALSFSLYQAKAQNDTISPDTAKINSTDTIQNSVTGKQPAINPPKEIFTTFGQLYERVELNRGYMQPIPARPDVDYFGSPDLYNSVRARFGFEYYLRNKFTFRLSFQSVKYFGSVPQYYQNRVFMAQPLYEAWGEYYFTNTLSVKAGLMPLSYDKERILGAKDWLPQSINHNAIVLKYEDMIDLNLGVAYDLNNPLDILEPFEKRAYKLMQFAWLGGYIGNMDISLIALNMSVPEIEYQFSPFDNYIKPLSYTLVSQQTIGSYMNIGTSPVYVEAEFYYQTGKYPQDWVESDSLTAAGLTLNQFNQTYGTYLLGGPGLGKHKSAYMFSVTANYENKKMLLTAGYDHLSGNSYLATGTDNNNTDNAFDPILGSNHKFYGAMDYFYANSWTTGYSRFTPGLRDMYASINYTGKSLEFNIAGHYFAPAGTVWYTDYQTTQSQQITSFGYESDIFVKYSLVPEVATITLGTSLLKPTDGLLYLKDFDYTMRKNLYYSLWVAFRLTPTFDKIYKFNKKITEEIGQ